MSIKKLSILLLILLSTIVLVSVNFSCIQSEKINGVSFVAPVHKTSGDAFNEVLKIHANWVCLMPYAYTKEGDNTLNYNVDWQWWGEKNQGVEECIKMAHDKKLRVMLKPHVWLQGADYTGNFKLEKESDWIIWEQGYADYLLTHANIAQKYNVELLCIGTELETFVDLRPEFWKKLIKDVKQIYKGKLTYAGNWDAYKRFPFWAEMDYIGVDAYFPLSESKTPSVSELKKGWQRWTEELNTVSTTNNKPILFTEYGYRSCDFTAKEPWSSYNKLPVNMQAQVNALTALYSTMYAQPWFAGGFLWKWHDTHEKAGGAKNEQYTVQNKPASVIVQEYFSRY